MNTKNLPEKNTIIIFLVFSLGYFLSTLLRAIPATISPFLTDEFNISASELGLLGGAYFIGFALMQLPLGYLLDKYGPKLILCTLLIFAITGIILFSLANEFRYLLLGRFLIGIGVSACLMAPLTGYRKWFKEIYQYRANSWMLMIGSIGMLASTIPVYYLLSIYGWRIVFFGISLLVLICILLIAKKTPSWKNHRNNKNKIYSLSIIWKNKYFQSLVPIALFNVAGFYSMITLWAGPWMNKISGYGPEKTAISLFIINILLILGYLIWGYLSPKILQRGININQILTRGIPFTLLFLLLIIISGKHAGLLLWSGYFVSCVIFSITLPTVTLTFPSNQAGKVLTLFNLLFFIGIFILQWGIGVIIDLMQKIGYLEIYGFRFAILILLITNTLSYIYFLIKNKNNSNFKY